jgi:hypothetical protein
MNQKELTTQGDFASDTMLRLYELTNEIISADSVDRLIDSVINTIRNITGCMRISVMLLSEDGNYLYIRKAIGIDESIIQSTKIRVGEKIAGKAFSRKKVIISDPKKFDGSYFAYREKGPFMSIPLLEVPARPGAQPVGVINVTNKATGEAFTENEKKLLSLIANAASIALKNALRKEALEKSEIDTLILLINVIEARDKYTQGHSIRVGMYAAETARRLGFSEEDVTAIQYAGQLHDIGKIEVPDAILLKDGPLTSEEYEVMKHHPITSKRLVDHIAYFQPITGLFLHHHEHFNGRGYPEGIGGEEIEIGARILAVADAFDAMTSKRPYRSALSLSKVFTILEIEKGKQFDPECVDAFFDYIRHERV